MTSHVIIQQEYIADLRAAILQEFSAVDMQAVYGAVADPANLWAVFDAYADAIATRATDRVVPL